MRLKEFLTCIGIFTILYVLFFIIYDAVSLKIMVKKKKKEAYKKIDNNSFQTFALFYGLNATVDKEFIKKVYDKYKIDSSMKISEVSQSLNISNNELVIILLFLEYLELSPERNIFLQADTTTPLTSIDQTLVNKYKYFINAKMDFNSIKEQMGVSTNNDLFYLDSRFIFPGVRIINSVIYYVGDINEKK